MNEITNTIEAVGRLSDCLYMSHESYGEKLYAGTISVKRLSGAEDNIPVIIPGRIISYAFTMLNKYVRITGQFRSHNKVINGKGRLLVNIFVQNIEEAEESTTNSVQIIGRLCKPPIYRSTPFGRDICDIMLAVNRAFGRSDYIPCIAWGRNADRAANFKVGDTIKISGRFQSRIYEKYFDDGTSVTMTAYEVSIFNLEKEGAA